MYGNETISFNAHVQNGIVKWFPTRIGFGGNRKVTPKMNTNISDVSVLSKFGDDSLFLSIYHNIYAKNSIKPFLFRDKQVSKYKLSEKIEGQFQEWKEI
ncbi:MAG: hypothetical protein JXB49_21960 [Bacteroidales bacterium]|nr:hypothetical protein [Bacteroidales bacterium]